MTFLAPMQLLWLSLLVPLIALYVLKRRRQRRVIGSTLLWEQALRDMRAERPWKKLIPQVSLLLQILAIVVGSIALARPAGAGSVPSGAWVAVVVDTSASMAARQGNSTRFAHARDAALDIARSLPPGGRMMLVEANAEGDVLAPLTSDRASLELAGGVCCWSGSEKWARAEGLGGQARGGGEGVSQQPFVGCAAALGSVSMSWRQRPLEISVALSQ